MPWALRRQIIGLIIFIAVVLIFGLLVLRPYFNRAPSCTDGKQNGTETGKDCGGKCAKVCIAETDPVSVLWSRAFRVIPGRYNAVAYLENHNESTAIDKIGYRFRFADENNVYVGEREGTTFIPPSGNFAVFEPAVELGHSIPVFTTFEFIGVPAWTKVSEEKIKQLKILVSNIELLDENISPRLGATVRNNSLFSIPEVNVVAILYDQLGNAVSVSRTYLDTLLGEESRDITFTWPEPIPGKVIAKEIIPMFNVFLAELK